MTIPQEQRLFWLIFGFGMALRILWALMMPVEPISDSAAYETFARNIAVHGVYGFTPEEPGAYWAVGPAAIAAATFLVFGVGNFIGVVLLNLLAGAVVIWLVWLLGRKWFDDFTALIAALLCALWPNLILFSTVLSSELWFMALTLGGLWFWERRGGWRDLLLCGVIWGAALYVRPVILLLPVALALVSVPDGGRALARAGVRAAVVMALIVATASPWTLRNARLFGEPVMMSTNFGPNFWMGNNPETTGGYMDLPPFVEGMTETERADALSAIAKDYIRQDPAGFALRTLKKALQLHERETIGVAWNPDIGERFGERGLLAAKLVATGYWYLLLALALGGIGLRLRHAPARALFHPAIAAWGYFTALHAVIVVEDRYHMPSSPFIALMAAYALACILRARGGRIVPAKEPART